MDEIQSKSLEFFKKGDEYYNSNDFNEAIRFYNKAISIDPFISHVYNNKGFLHLNLLFRNISSSKKTQFNVPFRKLIKFYKIVFY
jgi:tetratricopeptide (TPR) repeat protein